MSATRFVSAFHCFGEIFNCVSSLLSESYLNPAENVTETVGNEQKRSYGSAPFGYEKAA